MTQTYGDATLVAFADGELEEPRFTEVAEAVTADRALAERLELLVLGKDLAKAIYAPLSDRPIPGPSAPSTVIV